ncbi:response regulator [Novipirellula sp.]|uniref:hybrid sensor histidine kinase/response regulator n=1 Tax=Novipirellula sp. TaxID=2795430 RepID=UPI003567CA41
MDEQEFAQLLMETFLQELSEHIETLGRELLAVEKEQTPEQLDELWKVIFRAAHTLKGASAAVNVQPIQTACHHLEDIFGYFRDQRCSAPPAMISLMLKVIDGIEDISVRLRAEEPLDDSSLVQMLPELKRVADELTSGESTSSESSPATAEKPAEAAASSAAAVSSAAAASSPPVGEARVAAFLHDLDDHVATISSNALGLEAAKNDAEKQNALTSLLQATSCLKSSAANDSDAASDLAVVCEVCDHLERLITRIQNENQDVTAELVSRILEAANSFAETGRRLRDGRDLQTASIQKMSDKLSKLDPAKHDPSREPQSTAAIKSSQPAKPFEPPKPSESGKRVAAAEQAASIRVPAQKLDALLAYSGELLVVRGRFSLREKDANDLRDLVTELKSRWLHSQRTRRQTTPNRSAFSPPSVSPPSGSENGESWIEETSKSFTLLTKKIEALSTLIEADNRLLGQTCSQLDDEVYHVRMLPFTDACGGLGRAVRDIATASNKKVNFKIEGGDVEVDRSVLEGLKDPLLHLVRNAVDHGIEKTAERTAAGKPETASVTVSASLRGGQVEVVVQDDGAGFDLDRICGIAKKRGLEVPEDRREQARLVFAPGFSTAKMITDISGRGVGLDVVQSRVESLHGAVDVTFRVGQWTRFTLVVPLTLTTIRSLLVRVNDEVYAIPTTAVRRMVRFGINEVRTSLGRDTLLLSESPTPIVSLAATLGLKSKGLIAGKLAKGLAVILAAGEQRVAVTVDDVLTEQEVLVKNLGSRIRRLRHFSGCTLLPTGRIAMVMNASNVVRTALGIAPTYSHSTRQKQESTARKQLLLADDSVTTRELLKNILETAGYDVIATADGEQAWMAAQEHHFDAVVSDVDMPRMDGFELTLKLRNNTPTAEIPIVLVTARGSDSDKERGVQSGANGYIVKGSFDQANLLDTLAQLV